MKSAQGSWYCTFKSPTGSIHWFTFEFFAEDPAQSKMHLYSHRIDGVKINPEFRLAVETSELFVALLARDGNDPRGMFSMILKHRPSEGTTCEALEGSIVWNSLTDGTVKTGALQFTRSPPEGHIARLV